MHNCCRCWPDSPHPLVMRINHVYATYNDALACNSCSLMLPSHASVNHSRGCCLLKCRGDLESQSSSAATRPLTPQCFSHVSYATESTTCVLYHQLYWPTHSEAYHTHIEAVNNLLWKLVASSGNANSQLLSVSSLYAAAGLEEARSPVSRSQGRTLL